MQKKIYSLIIALLSVTLLYIAISTRNTNNKNKVNLKSLKEIIQQQKDSIIILQNKQEESSNFMLATNPDAKEVLYKTGYDSKMILDALYKTNDIAPNNALVPYEGTMGGVMKINNARVLNNKWIIADYSDGYFWGEILIAYTFDENNKIHFETFRELLYPHR